MFNVARGFCGVTDNPVNMSVIAQVELHEGVRLDYWEREVVFAMDRAFRHAYSDVLQWQSKRPTTNKDPDKGRTSAFKPMRKRQVNGR